MMGGFIRSGKKTSPAKIPMKIRLRSAKRRSQLEFWNSVAQHQAAIIQQSMPAPVFATYPVPALTKEEVIDSWPTSGILVSAILSIHNRTDYIKRALEGYLWQTLPPDRWEIILVDDMSTEDTREAYKDLSGRINLRHVLIDHTRHPVFTKRNPGWERGDRQNWYHTPAITLNAGFSLAKGPVLCICHPEILHAPTNFEKAAIRLRYERTFICGATYLGDKKVNKWLNKNSWTQNGWPQFLEEINAKRLLKLGHKELAWDTSFLSKDAALAVGGIDFEYLNGVTGEGEDFKERLKLAGWRPVHVPGIEGMHQDYEREKDSHRRRYRGDWKAGEAANSATLKSRLENGFPKIVNTDYDWTAKDCIVDILEYALK